MEQRGYDLVHGVPRVARLDRRQRLVVVAQRVHVEQPRGREQQREHVGQGHGHEHDVGGRAHVPFGQHDHDQRVGHDGDQQQERHDEPVHGPRVLDRHLVRHVQVTAGRGAVAAVAVRRRRRRFGRGTVEVAQHTAVVVRGHDRGIVLVEAHGAAACAPVGPGPQSPFGSGPDVLGTSGRDGQVILPPLSVLRTTSRR